MGSVPVEAAMRAPVCEMTEFGDLGVRFQAEVPLGVKRIDLAGLSSDSCVYAVELKVKDWRRAAWQASVYQLCANYAFVALRGEYVHRVDRAYLQRLGIGLIAVNDRTARLVLDATPSGTLHPDHHGRLRDALTLALACQGGA